MNRELLFQLFKYAVYALLTANVFIFWYQESGAAAVQFPQGVGAADLIEAYAATIDTAAWVVLLLMFELETYILQDRHFTPPVVWSLHGLRVVSYTFIVYAFYGYFENLVFLFGATPLAGVSNLCSLVGDGWAYAVGLDDYVALAADNCSSLSAAGGFLQFPGMSAVADEAGYSDIVALAWVDLINAGVWLLVVVVLEIDVRLQEHNRLEGLAYRISYFAKAVLYSTLFGAAVYWGFEGDFVDFWDAFLWLVAFVFIELNVFEWRQESLESVTA